MMDNNYNYNWIVNGTQVKVVDVKAKSCVVTQEICYVEDTI